MEFDETVDAIIQLAKQQDALTRTMEVHGTVLVNDLINTQCKDVNKICHHLDSLLSFAYDEKILLLYKKLCRYLYDIDPHGASDYVNYYREMWDSK